MKIHTFTKVVVLLVMVVFFNSCSKKDRIEGQVKDIFGNPLSGVTVKIEKSKFSSITDNKGKYSLDYAPGLLKLIFSKKGYTTTSLTLDIRQKSYYPAPDIILYPIPKDKGIFYIDMRKKQLIKLEPNCRINLIERKYYGHLRRYRYYVKYLSSLPVIKSGKVQFIDTLPHTLSYKINLFRPRKDGLIYEEKEGILKPWIIIYSGLLKDSISEVGKEGLVIRTINLSPNVYVWVKTDFFGGYPKRNSFAFCFKVKGANR